jgi:hypothetical protein
VNRAARHPGRFRDDPLTQTRRAYELLEQPAPAGKVVLVP